MIGHSLDKLIELYANIAPEWINSDLLYQIGEQNNKIMKKNKQIYFLYSFAVRLLPYHIRPDSEEPSLLTLHNKDRGIWEFPKGKFESDRHDTVDDAAEWEKKEEAPAVESVQHWKTERYRFADTITPIDSNADILIKEMPKNKYIIKIVYLNYNYPISVSEECEALDKKFIPEHVPKDHIVYNEHDKHRWRLLRKLEPVFRSSVVKGYNSDYKLYNNVLQIIPYKDLITYSPQEFKDLINSHLIIRSSDLRAKEREDARLYALEVSDKKYSSQIVKESA